MVTGEAGAGLVTTEAEMKDSKGQLEILRDKPGVVTTDTGAADSDPNATKDGWGAALS